MGFSECPLLFPGPFPFFPFSFAIRVVKKNIFKLFFLNSKNNLLII
jgi:hypothetical protein